MARAGIMLCALLIFASAQADDAVELSPVFVDGTRIEVLDSGVVIRERVDPLDGASLADLLSRLPGVQVRSAGGLGSYSEASLRGSSGRQVRVLLDGLPLDGGGGEAASLSLISPLLLDEVEVYKGRVPIGLGSGLAGTINLHSRRELPAPVVASAGLGSFGQRQLDLAGQLGDAQLALGTQSADNDFHYVNEYRPYDPEDPDRTESEARRNAATRQHYGLLRWQGPINVSVHRVNDHQQLPTQLNDASADAELETHSTALALTSPRDADWNFALSHRRSDEVFRDPNSQIGLGAQQTHSRTDRSLLSLGRDLAHWQSSANVEFTEYTAQDDLGDVPTASARRLSAGAGLGYAASVGRHSHYNASLQTAWSRDESAGTSEVEWQIEPAIGATQRFGACALAANLGYRKRLPTFFERYGDRGLFKGNPALKPESATYGDFGGQCGFGERIERMQLTLFGQDLRDVISPTYTAQGVGRSINTERGLIYGVEASAAGAVSVAQEVSWELGLTWQHTEDRSDIRATRGKQLPGRYETQINTRLEKRWSMLSLFYAWRLEAGQYYDSPNNLKAPEMQSHDVGVRGALKRVGWSLQAINLSDDRAEQFNGYPMPGRRWMLLVTYPDAAAAGSTH